jgi:hypothetical protein
VTTAEYEVEALDRFGGGVVPLDNAVPERVGGKLNTWRTGKFTIGVKDDGAIAADLLNCRGTRRSDIRIRRNGQTLIWGPITRAEANRATVDVQVSDPLWHLFDLNFGPLRYNYAVNPNGDQGTAGWTAAGGVALSIDNGDFAKRPQCFTLVGGGGDGYMGQLIAVQSNVDQPVVFVISGWAKIDTWAGPALEERGLFVARASDPANPKWAPITEATKQGSWEFLRVEITVPANSSDVLDLRGYGIDGVIKWGRFRVSVYESTGTGLVPEDAIHPITRVINLAQDPAWGYPPLNITKAGGLTGTLIEIHYQFVERGNIGEALLDYTRKGICDLGVVYPDPSTRTLEIFSPRRGRFVEGVVLDVDVAGSLADFRYAVDGEQTYSAVGVSGPHGEEAFSFDYSLNSGIRRERREERPDMPIGDLEPYGDVELARAKGPVLVPTYTTHEQSGDLVGVITEGDRALCRVDHGAVLENTERRIVGWDLNCRTDIMTLEVNA